MTVYRWSTLQDDGDRAAAKSKLFRAMSDRQAKQSVEAASSDDSEPTEDDMVYVIIPTSGITKQHTVRSKGSKAENAFQLPADLTPSDRSKPTRTQQSGWDYVGKNRVAGAGSSSSSFAGMQDRAVQQEQGSRQNGRSRPAKQHGAKQAQQHSPAAPKNGSNGNGSNGNGSHSNGSNGNGSASHSNGNGNGNGSASHSHSNGNGNANGNGKRIKDKQPPAPWPASKPPAAAQQAPAAAAGITQPPPQKRWRRLIPYLADDAGSVAPPSAAEAAAAAEEDLQRLKRWRSLLPLMEDPDAPAPPAMDVQDAMEAASDAKRYQRWRQLLPLVSDDLGDALLPGAEGDEVAAASPPPASPAWSRPASPAARQDDGTASASGSPSTTEEQQQRRDRWRELLTDDTVIVLQPDPDDPAEVARAAADEERMQRWRRLKPLLSSDSEDSSATVPEPQPAAGADSAEGSGRDNQQEPRWRQLLPLLADDDAEDVVLRRPSTTSEASLLQQAAEAQAEAAAAVASAAAAAKAAKTAKEVKQAGQKLVLPLDTDLLNPQSPQGKGSSAYIILPGSPLHRIPPPGHRHHTPYDDPVQQVASKFAVMREQISRSTRPALSDSPFSFDDRWSRPRLGGGTIVTMHTAKTPGSPRAQYRVVKHLGSGGNGAAYLVKLLPEPGMRGQQQQQQRRHSNSAPDVVVLKLCLKANMPSFKAVNWAAADHLTAVEAAVAAVAAGAPHLLAPLDYGLTEGAVPSVVLPLARGGDLYSKLSLLSRKDEWEVQRLRQLREALGLVLPVAKGLAHLHSKGWLHGDVKPENVLDMGDGRLVLADYGSAAQLQDGLAYGRRGTPGYCAPEVLVKGGSYGTAADVWSLGIMLLELLMQLSGPELVADLTGIDEDKQVRELLWRLQGWRPWWVLPVQARQLLLGMLFPDAHSRPTAAQVVSAVSALLHQLDD